MLSGVPALSVVLVAPRSFDRVRKTIARLAAQSVRAKIELVLVTDSAEPSSGIDAALDAFASLRVVRVDSLGSRAIANAAGARLAAAPIVAFAEDHSFPAPGWAAALLARHVEGFAAVGPAVENANPGTAVSWCDLLINYHPWVSPRAGPAASLPGHNTSYERRLLEQEGERLARWLDVEAEFHVDLGRRGERLCCEPAARIEHVNVSRGSAWLPALFDGGRVYAAARSRAWPRARRLLYSGAWPLLGIVRLARILREWPDGAPSRLRLGPILLVGLEVDAAGQAAGYLRGPGRSESRLAAFELERASQVVEADLSAFEPDVHGDTFAPEASLTGGLGGARGPSSP